MTTPLQEHIARAESTGAFVLEVNQEIPGNLDDSAQPGFVMMLRDGKGRIMLAELSIAGDRSGVSAVISAYDAEGAPYVLSLTDIGNQVIVTVD